MSPEGSLARYPVSRRQFLERAFLGFLLTAVAPDLACTQSPDSKTFHASILDENDQELGNLQIRTPGRETPVGTMDYYLEAGALKPYHSRGRALYTVYDSPTEVIGTRVKLSQIKPSSFVLYTSMTVHRDTRVGTLWISNVSGIDVLGEIKMEVVWRSNYAIESVTVNGNRLERDPISSRVDPRRIFKQPSM